MQVPSWSAIFFAATLWLGPVTLQAADFGRPVTMTPVFHSSLPQSVRTPEFLMTRGQDGLPVIRGRDTANKPWQVVPPPEIHGLWRAAVRGSTTYYFAGSTGGSDMAPQTWVMALSFDDQGRPVPFFVRTQHADYNEQRFKDVIDLNGKGPALVQQDWAETDWMPEAAHSGYYIVSLYQQRGLYWYRADGRHGNWAFPAYEKWASSPKPHSEQAQAQMKSVFFPNDAKLSSPARPQPADYSNDPRSGLHSRFLRIDRNGIHLAPEAGCDLQSWDMVVRDSAKGREIEADFFYANYPGKLLPEIARDRMPVVLSGVTRPSGKDLCAASIVWAINTQ